MSETLSAKQLLIEYNRKHFRDFTLNDNPYFTLNDNPSLTLPAVSFVPGVGASKRHNRFKKIISHPGCAHHIKFITKNSQPDSFLWQTNASQLKDANRWGIVKTRSITGKVIGALGQYRVVAHKRIAKGMSSTSQYVKLKLLDLFQDRFEALQELESLVNKKASERQYERALVRYIRSLEDMNKHLSEHFKSVSQIDISKGLLDEIALSIQADIERAQNYLNGLQVKDNLTANNSARGLDSILGFVKQQMIHGLYEFQGLNENLTYNPNRNFALTRGELNDFIVDARKEIDDHQPDLWNTVTDKHHGLYTRDEDLITYDFAEDYLTPEREREVLLAISFIEEWDKVADNSGVLSVKNNTGEEPLDIVSSTYWKTHRYVTTAAKSVGYFIYNIFKGVLFPTHPWEEEAWSNKDFHLFATELRQHARPNEPLWQKPARFFRQVFYAFADVFNGIRDFGSHLTIHMPDDVLNDWESTKSLSDLSDCLSSAGEEIKLIKETEEERLAEILKLCGYRLDELITDNTSKLARVEYELTAGEQNDILTAIAKGINGFSSLFTHNIFAKDPIGGLLFTTAYAVGAGAIYMPSSTAAIFGQNYVDWFSNFSYTMGSSKFGAAIAGGSSQAQFAATLWDSIAHGPSGIATNGVYQIGEDPLTIGAYSAAAYSLGYVLANGIAGHKIPWLSDHLKQDLGTVPEAGYPIVGAKVAILLYEGLVNERLAPELPSQILPPDDRILQASIEVDLSRKQIYNRFRLATWLSIHKVTVSGNALFHRIPSCSDAIILYTIPITIGDFTIFKRGRCNKW